jgi:hypothetical protein
VVEALGAVVSYVARLAAPRQICQNGAAGESLRQTALTEIPGGESVPRDKDKGKAHKRKRPSKALIGRVKRAVKKSRRKMDEERFHKELRRTIQFLEGINEKITASPRKSGKGSSTNVTPAIRLKPAQTETGKSAAARTRRRVQVKKKK